MCQYFASIYRGFEKLPLDQRSNFRVFLLYIIFIYIRECINNNS